MKNFKVCILPLLLLLFLLLLSIFYFLFSVSAFADDYIGSSFISRDPVITSGGGYSSSDNFQLFGAISQLAIGTSSSNGFGVSAGFLFFPAVTTPVVIATAGNGQVSLSWSHSVGYLGWTVSGYNVGKSTSTGGPYTYSSSLGYVNSSNRTGLTNGTKYYFIIRAEDAFGNSIATSSEIYATPTAPAPSCGDGSCNGSETCSTCSADCGRCGGGGGGGGWTPPAPQTQVIFKGRAYPKSSVTLLKDAQIAATTIAGSDANFTVSLSGLAAGNYIFSVYSEDSKGRRSSLLTFPVSVTAGATTQVSGIFIAPTIAVDKSEVKRGDNIAIFGQSAPQAEIVISVNSEEEFFMKTNSDEGGIYLYNFDTSPLAIEQHFTKSKAAFKGELSSFSQAVSFWVGTKNVAAAPPSIVRCDGKADLNGDCRVNLVDFSIAAYWYKRVLSADFKTKETERLNGDGKVDLVDFSIMAYYWTG